MIIKWQTIDKPTPTDEDLLVSKVDSDGSKKQIDFARFSTKVKENPWRIRNGKPLRFKPTHWAQIPFPSELGFEKGDILVNEHTKEECPIERVDGFDAIIKLRTGNCIRITESEIQKSWSILKNNS